MAVEIALTENKANRLKSRYTSKVFPAKSSIGEDISVLQDDMQDPQTQEDSMGFALMFATKNKKKQAALKLIDNGSDIHFLDQTKCNVLHYAAVAGYEGLILKLLSKGASVKIRDCNGETALHKAARSGHDTTVVALVANDADVYALNWQGQTPLELAVMGKHVKVIEALCLFGSDLVMQDWQWLEDTIQSRKKEDRAIVETLKRQNYRVAGYKHGGIKFDVKHVEPGSDTNMKKLGATLLSQNLQHLPYYIYCSKIHVEYTNVREYISEGEELFSDIYECKTWGPSGTTFTLKLKLNGVPKCNETLKAISPYGNVANIDSSSRFKRKNYTDVTVTVHIKHGAVVAFMFVTITQPEVFSILHESVIIQPKMEPGAELDIPKDTFDSPGHLLFNVLETKNVNIVDAESNKEVIIVTNIIDISMSNHQQPKKPIDMKLPTHSTINDDNEIVILTSSKEFPEEIKDWKIIAAKRDSRHRSASFKITHFSIFTGVTKKKVDTDMIGVCKEIQKALNKERQVEFFALAKVISCDEYAIIIECALERKASKRKKTWEKAQYEIQAENMCHTVQINQWFRIKFGGNINIIGTEKSDTQKLLFHPNRDNYQIFKTEISNRINPPVGRIQIELIEEREQEPIIVLDSVNCCKNKETVIPRDPITTYTNLTSLSIHLQPPSAVNEDNQLKIVQHLTDNDCTIEVLKISSLMQLAKKLNKDEAQQLAIQLNVTPTEVVALAKELPKIDDLLHAVFWKWRGRRPYGSQVNSLIAALVKIEKEFEAEEVRMAQKDDREICLSW
ncbi:uncharacterized protein LOC127730521 isoform X6 [Mytilus californianus]|uniref:uncharacterized protein LOC127730521 isoform X6 n=1 Tax=Mytilus californianus TaxID=6549 RepID=UPI002246EF29|nr:uncharacterized protein LOC127730521 isoform X6 [Mytilus californianus]